MQVKIDEERQEADRRLTSSSNEVPSPSFRKLDKRIDLSAMHQPAAKDESPNAQLAPYAAKIVTRSGHDCE